mgnify:CR=1 FL=1
MIALLKKHSVLAGNIGLVLVMLLGLAYLTFGSLGWRPLAKTYGLTVELPNSVVREVIYTEPAVKGDTSGKVMKPAKISSGFELPVPAFVEIGDKIEIDTRTDEYRNRVK